MVTFGNFTGLDKCHCLELQKVQTSLRLLHSLQGGSYGRETVLRGYSDGTLVLFMDHFRSFRDQKENQRELLSVIEQRLKHHKKYSTSVSLGHTLEVLLSVQGQEILLQVLPAFDPLCECSRDWGRGPKLSGSTGEPLESYRLRL